MKKICVLGLGYIGLPTASILATHGFKVIGVDVNEKVIDSINHCHIDTIEPGLDALVSSAVKSVSLEAKLEPEKADAFIICVPTPLTNDHKADLSYVRKAAKGIVSCLRKNNLVILESTVPPGTTTEVVAHILERSGLRAGEDFYLAYCPERVLPGKILKELVENDRVIGGINSQSTQMAKEVYQSFVTAKIHLTDSTTAEMTKLVENIFRDVNIAFANEVSKICDRFNLDVWQVVGLANKHPRVNVLRPGPGVGGHCTAVDPWFIIQKAPKDAKFIRTAREINDSMPDHVVEKVDRAIKKMEIKDPIIGCLGITYKANVDDLRESPALKIVKILINKGYKVRVCEPNVDKHDEFDLYSLEETVGNADCLLILVAHEEFVGTDFAVVLGKMRNKIIIDTTGILKGRGQESFGMSGSMVG